MFKDKFIFDLQRFKEIYNDKSNTLLSGTNGNNTIQNAYAYEDSSGNWIWHDGGSNVTIDAGAGNDYIENNGSYVTIISGSGNDYIDNYDNKYVLINAGAGNDSIFNYSGEAITINAHSGNDYVENYAENVTINGGSGNDTIYNNWDLEKNNPYDDFYNLGSNVLFKYSYGNGNDIIYGFKEDSTLSISGSSYFSIKSGNDIIVTVGEGNITLIGAANFSKINIDFKERDSWRLSGTKATYGTELKTLVTVKGVKSVKGLSVDGTTVTVSKASLNKTDVTISGDGYTLELGNDVTKPSTTKAWNLSHTTATYKQTTSAGYTLASNSKSINYSKKAVTTLTTVKGVKSLDGLSLSGNVVTVSAASLGTNKVTISGEYALKLAKDVAKPTNKKAAWTLKNSIATYKSAYKTAGYTLANDAKSISYSKATTPTKLATIKGVNSLDNLKVSGKTIKLSGDGLSNNVTVSGDYNFYFNADYKDATITGSSGNDTITTRGNKISVKGGKGDDTIKILGSGTVAGGAGADVFYFKSSGTNVITDYAEEDKISLASGAAKISTKGNNVIFSVDSEKITVKNAKDKSITYIDNGGEKIYKASDETIKFNDEGTGATLTAKYTADEFTPNDYSDYVDTLITIDAAQVTNPLTITGNKKPNQIIGTNEDDLIDGGAGADKIYGADGNDTLNGGAGNDKLYGDAGDDSLWGGAGSDTLFGGDGDDIFFYKNGDGNDVIADFTDMDKIIVNAADIGNPTTNNGDVTFTVGLGKIVIKNGADKVIQLYDESGGELSRRYTPGRA